METLSTDTASNAMAGLSVARRCSAMAMHGSAVPSKGKAKEAQSTERKNQQRGTNMRNELEVAETTEERRERLREELEARKATLRIVKGLCLWVSGAMMILSAMAGIAEMTYECVLTGMVALVALLYGLA